MKIAKLYFADDLADCLMKEIKIKDAKNSLDSLKPHLTAMEV